MHKTKEVLGMVGGGEAGGKKRDTRSGLMIAFVLESRFQNISPVLQEQNVSVSETTPGAGTSDKTYAVWCSVADPWEVLKVKL